MPMGTEEVVDGRRYSSDSNGEIVLVIDLDIETKDNGDTNWYKGVIYSSETPGEDINRCRRIDDFARKYSPAEVVEE